MLYPLGISDRTPPRLPPAPDRKGVRPDGRSARRLLNDSLKQQSINNEGRYCKRSDAPSVRSMAGDGRE